MGGRGAGQRAVGDAVTGLEGRINARFDEVNGHFDAIYQRLDRLETECQMIVVGMKRIEERLDE